MTKKLLSLLLCMIMLLTLCCAAFADAPRTYAASRSGASGEARIVDICALQGWTACLMSDGTVKAAGKNSDAIAALHDWTDIVSISTNHGYVSSGEYLIGVKSDGTALVAGRDGWSGMKDWRDIVGVSTCWGITLGLHSDGTVVYSGGLSWVDDDDLRKFISSWKNVKEVQAIVCGYGKFIFGLSEDGHVYSNAACNGWEKIADLHSSGWLTLGLKTDGTVVADGTDYDVVNPDVSTWTDVARIYAGDTKALAVRKDGTVLAAGSVGYKEELAAWRDIKELFNVDDAIIGLKEDGSVVIVSTPRNDPILDEAAIKQIASWTDIVKISASETHVVGLKKDGTLVFAGDNSCGQFDIG